MFYRYWLKNFPDQRIYHCREKKRFNAGSDIVDSQKTTGYFLSRTSYRYNHTSVQANANSSLNIPEKFYHFILHKRSTCLSQYEYPNLLQYYAIHHNER